VIAFTILGLLVFWAWCFQFGYWLGYGAQVLDAFVRIELASLRLHRSISAFIAMQRSAA
jgi:hypothetical protein